MTIALERRTIWDALLFEPLELIKAQPHQVLISGASIALVAAEAGVLISYPWNIALGVGAEWAYLRGMASKQAARTRWAAGLNISSVLLVVLYGMLAGLRKYHAIPDQPDLFGAVVLTAIHILTIGSVTLCSAMVHRSALAAELAIETERAAQAAAERAHQAEQQAAAVAAEQERRAIQAEKDREYERWEKAQRLQAELKIEALNARRSVRANTPAAPPNAAPGTATNTDGEQLREQIVRTLTADPAANRAALARSLSIGRTRLYELIADARARGELPD